MIFEETRLKGAYLIRPERLEDERGFFARVWCQREFQEQGLEVALAQCNISYNRKKFTLRGMHFQKRPYEEVKLVRCTAGAIFDVIVDIRPDSPTFRDWLGVELNAENRHILYIPKGFAHGFLTLSDDVEIFYQMSEFYTPGAGRGFRWDDPAIGIRWPLTATPILSEQDRAWPAFAEVMAESA